MELKSDAQLDESAPPLAADFAYDFPGLFLFYAESYRLIQSWVRGFPINSLDYRDLKRVWLERS